MHNAVEIFPPFLINRNVLPRAYRWVSINKYAIILQRILKKGIQILLIFSRIENKIGVLKSIGHQLNSSLLIITVLKFEKIVNLEHLLIFFKRIENLLMTDIS